MVFEANISTLISQKRDSDLWNMATPAVDVPITGIQNDTLRRVSVPEVVAHPPAMTLYVPDGDFVIECDDTEIVTDSAIPSSGEDDGISMNFSLGSMEDGGGGIFMTESSGRLPIHGSSIYAGNLDKSASISRGSLSNSIIGSSIGGGNDKDNASVVTSSIIHPSLSGGDSRASLISLGKPKTHRKDERWYHILSQMGIPFLIAGLGMVGAGILLDHVMKWPVFIAIAELVVLVTPLLGLKGNLEMTLAARLSTHANIGNMDIPGQKWRICSGNLVLDQLQAIICGLVASVIAIGIGYSFQGDFHFNHATLVVATSILTASMVSLILGTTMISVILLSKRFRINPDNVATPVAGSLGDVVTLGMLSCFASIIFQEMEDGKTWIPFAILSVYIVILPCAFVIAYRNEFTRQVVISGWIPLIISVGISTGGGILLDLAGSRHPGLPLYQPVINGIGGNLVSVQASRISTQLHGECEKKILPNTGRVCESPFTVFFTKSVNSMSARLLLLLAVPGHLIFSTVTHFVTPSGDSQYGPLFLALYITAAVLQVAMLLYIAKIMTNLCWRRGIDPDTTTIPYLTALGDLFGSGLLFLAFEILTTLSA